MSTTAQSGNGHPPTGPTLRSLTRRVHYLAGLAIGPFLVVLCLTGLAYAFTPTINEFVYRDLWTVDVGGSAPRPVSEQVAAALAAVPDAELAGVEAGEPGRSTAVVLEIPDLAADGLLNEIVMALLAIGALVLLALGYRMWWRRRGSPNASADVRGPSLVQLEPRVGVGVALATVVVAWAMPLLSVTLAGFLLLDVAVSRSRRMSPVSQHR